MINYIISDEYKEAVKTKTVVDNYMMNFDIEVKYHIFDKDDKELKDKINKIKGFKIYILSNDSISNDGVYLTKYIRYDLEDWNSVIILTTNHSEKKNVLISNKLFIFDFICKDCYFENNIKEDLNNIKKYYRNRHNCLTFESNRTINKIDFRNILMISKEKDSNKCIINSSMGNYYTCESLKDVSKRLDNRFIKINRSCIVNGDKIVEYNISENKITLKNGFVSYDISRDNKKQITSKFISYK